jgi:hypothetical protein
MSTTTDDGQIERNVAEIHESHIEEAADGVLVVDPTVEAIEQLLAVLAEHDDPASVRLLAAESSLKQVMGDFVAASTAADLIDGGTLSLRTTEEATGTSLLVTDDAVVSIVPSEGSVAGLTTRNGEFVADARERYTELWRGAEPFGLRTPPLSRIRGTLDEELGAAVRADFDAALGSVEAARDEESLDGVTLSLLVAAKNEALLYDVSKWGEDVGVASKATFSRVKTTLEEAGLIDTEKVPIDVGRPRLRLLLGVESLREADASRLPHLARELLDERE